MHILICVYFRASAGGLHENIFSTARHCIQSGHRVTVVCPEGPFRERLETAGIGAIASDYGSTEATVEQVLARGDASYDVIHTHPFASRKVSLALAERLRIPVVMTYHGMYPDDLPLLIERYAAVVAVSSGIRDYLAGLVPEHRRKLFVAPNGVDRSLFRAQPEAGPDVGPLRLALFSRLDKDKLLVIELLLEALRYCARSRRRQVHWTIVGAGTELERVKAEAEEIARGGDFPIDFVGWLEGEALADAYRAASIVIGPGRCALEAMACGRPVIAVGSKGYVGLVTQQTWQAGVYSNFGGLGRGLEGYERGSVEQDLAALMDSVELRSQLGALGERLTQAFNDEEVINAGLLTLFEIVAASGQA